MTQERRSFLLQTSILQQVNPELAAAVCENPDAAELLASLDRDNLFLAENRWTRKLGSLSPSLCRGALRHRLLCGPIASRNPRVA